MRQRKSSNPSYRVELLEPRLLLAADWAAGLAPAWGADGDAWLDHDALRDFLPVRAEPALDTPLEPLLPGALNLTALGELHHADDRGDVTDNVTPLAGSVGDPVRHEVVVIDAAVQGYEALVADFESRSGGDTLYDVHVLQANVNGVHALSEILAGYRNLDAVHIVSHGLDGGIQLSASRLDGASIAGLSPSIGAWSNALGDDADLLIYGCDLAGSAAGQALADTLATLTGADVAASTDATGQTGLGGDWDFEYRHGDVSSAVAFSTQIQNGWGGLLALFTVNTLDDTVDANPGDGLAQDASGNTSLRAAIMEANVLFGADTIVLPAGVFNLTIAGFDEDAGASGDLDIRQDLTIRGAGAGETVIDANGLDRVFEVHSVSAPDVVISGVAITGGDTTAAVNSTGGGIKVRNGASLTLDSVAVVDNQAFGIDGHGGGVSSSGNLTLVNVELSDNKAEHRGGGLYQTFAPVEVTLSHVTISGNSADEGGGLYSHMSPTLTNLTVANNTGLVLGGGIAVASGQSPFLANSLIANNTAPQGPDIYGTVASTGDNLVFDARDAAGLLPGDIQGLDPKLGALLDNGGPTRTHALLIGSPAINANTVTAASAIDQRGFLRDSLPDIGAYEQGATSASAGLWLSTRGDVASGGAPELPAWTAAEVIRLADPDLAFGADSDGTWSSIVDFEAAAFSDGSVDIVSIHRVSTAMTLGGNGFAAISVAVGDLLLTTVGNETWTNAGPEPDLSASNTDVVLFRPNIPGDYSSGTFSLLLDNPLGTGIHGISLVEADTQVGPVAGGTLLPAGSFVVVPLNGSQILAFTVDDVGLGSTTIRDLSGAPGLTTLVLDGPDFGFTSRMSGIELIESDAIIAGTTVRAGDFLVSLFDSDAAIGDGAPISADKWDVVLLRAIATGATSSADAFVFLDGNPDVHLDAIAEGIDGLTLARLPGGEAGNNPPVANDDSYSVAADTTLVVDAASGLLANDTDFDFDPLTLYLFSEPLNGRLSLNPIGLTDLRNLSLDASNDIFPDWSPDSSQIAFASARDGDFEIYVINADGTGLVQVTSTGSAERQPVWSPDGTQILYRSDADGTFDIYVMDADGSNPVRLTTGAAADGADEAGASWSPDGTRIVYRMDVGLPTIYVMDADGSNVQALTTPAATDRGPAWSPDGTTIAFISDRDGSDEIYLMDPDGTNVRRLTTNGATNGAPAWSPDGSKILFHSNIDGDFELFAMDADGSNVTQLTDNSDDDRRAVWSPDGTRIAFQTDRDGNNEIYVASIVSDGAFTYTPKAGFTGVDSFSYQVTDGIDKSDPATVTIEVNSNSAPTATNLTQSIGYLEDAPSVALSDIVVTDADAGETITASLTLADAAAGTLSAGSGNGETYTAGTGVWTVTGTVAQVNAALAAVAFVPAADSSVNTTISTRIEDLAGAGPMDGVITLTGTAVNDAPSLSTLGDQNVLEDSGAHTVAGFASPSPGGGADESGQSFSYSVSSDNPGLFLVGPAIDASGTLTYTLNANVNGTARVTVSVSDDGGTANGGMDTSPDQTFDIVVDAVSGTGRVDTTVTSPTDSTTENTDLVFSVTNGNAITVDDGTTNDPVLRTTLTVTNGVLNLAMTAGLTSVAGDGTSTIIVIGAESAINAALDGLTFSPTASFTGAVSLQVTTDTQADLLGYYNFTQSNPLGLDSSPASGNDATSSGPGLLPDPYAVFDVDRNSDVLVLDGVDDNMVIAGRFGTPSNVTLAAWVNVAAVNDQDVISIGGSIGLRLNDSNNGNGVTGFFNDDDDWRHTDSAQFIGGAGWHHVAFTFNDANNTQVIYIDGVALGTTSYSKSIDWDHQPNTTIGSHANGSGYWLDGMLDDVRIYDRALTASEIQAIATDQFSDTEVISITVLTDNDAPVLADDNPRLTAINEDDYATGGDSVAAIVVDGSITDPDGAAVESIAITAVDDSNGAWQYSTDNGATWNDVDDGSLGVGHALLLDGTLVGSDTQRLRFVPAADFSGSPEITFRAWDMSVGVAGTYADTADAGGTSAFSTATDTAGIDINPVNDAPSFSTLGDQNVLEDSGPHTVAGFAAALPGGGTDESGQSFSYTVNSDNPGLFLVGPAIDASGTLTYTLNPNANGSATVTVRVTDSGGTANGGVDASPDQTFDIVVGAVNDAPSFSTLGDQNVLEDAGAQTVVGFASALPGGGADESGQSFSYTVSSDNPGLFLVGPAIDASGTLTYTLNPNANGSATVTVRVTDSGGTANGGVDASPDQTFDIVVGAVNDAPSFSTLGDQNVLEDAGAQTVVGFASALPGGGADESGQSFSYTVSSDNPGLFLVGPAIDASGTLTYTLNANVNGTATITVSVSDDGGTANGGADTSPDQTFDIIVGAVNDAPSFSTLGDQNVLEDSGPHTVAGFAAALPGGGTDESGQTFSYTVNSDNPGLFLVGPAIDASGTLTYTLNANVNGTATITVSVSDDGGIANGGADTSPDQTFDIIVGAVNDTPSFSRLGDQNVLEDSGPHTVAGFAAALPGGGTDESGQTFSYTVNSDNPGLFLVGPAIDASGTLTYTLNANVNGTATITVSVSDDGGTANGGADTSPDQTFDIIVGAVNDTPSFSTLGDQNVLEDAGAQTVVGFASALPGGGTDESGQSFSYTVNSDNPGLFLVGPAIDASGTLTYTLNANVNGTATITVSVSDDGGTASGGVDTSTNQTFDIVALPLDSAPTATGLTQSHLYLEDSGPVALHDILVSVASGNHLLTATLTLSDVQTGSLSMDSGNGEYYSSITGQWTITGTVAQVNAALAAVQFVPVADNAVNSTVFTHIENSGGQGPVDGVITLSVTPVNDAPSGNDSLVSLGGDSVYVLSMANFGYADPVEGDALLGVQITSLPGLAGSLMVGDQIVTVGATVSAIDIDAGRLRFIPLPGMDHTAFGTLAFRVQDSGGTADGGVDVDPLENYLTFAVNQVSESTEGTVSNDGPPSASPDTEGAVVPPLTPDDSSDPAQAGSDTDGPTASGSEDVGVSPQERPQPDPVEIPTAPVVDQAAAQVIGIKVFPQLSAGMDAATDEAKVAVNDKQATVTEREAIAYEPLMTDSQDIALGIDQMRNAIAQEIASSRLNLGSSTVGALSLSVGYVSWLLRGGVLLGSVVSSLPVWTFIDPLPVFARDADGRDEEGEDESLESIVRNGSTREPAIDAQPTDSAVQLTPQQAHLTDPRTDSNSGLS